MHNTDIMRIDIMRILRRTTSREAFEAHLRDAQVQIDGDRLLILVPADRYEWVKHRMLDSIRDVMRTVGFRDVQVGILTPDSSSPDESEEELGEELTDWDDILSQSEIRIVETTRPETFVRFSGLDIFLVAVRNRERTAAMAGLWAYLSLCAYTRKPAVALHAFMPASKKYHYGRQAWLKHLPVEIHKNFPRVNTGALFLAPEQVPDVERGVYENYMRSFRLLKRWRENAFALSETFRLRAEQALSRRKRLPIPWVRLTERSILYAPVLMDTTIDMRHTITPDPFLVWLLIRLYAYTDEPITISRLAAFLGCDVRSLTGRREAGRKVVGVLEVLQHVGLLTVRRERKYSPRVYFLVTNETPLPTPQQVESVIERRSKVTKKAAGYRAWYEKFLSRA